MTFSTTLKSFALATVLVSSASASAYDFQVGDLCYNKLTDSTVEVAPKTRFGGDYAGLTSIVIPETVENNGVTYTVTGIAFKTFNMAFKATSVVMPNTITSIGEDAFKDCWKVETVQLSEGLTSLGSSAFEQCTALKSITIPNSVQYIGNKAFYNCNVMTSAVVGDGVTAIGSEAFANCSALSSVTLGSALEGFGDGAFYQCTALKQIELPQSLTLIGSNVFAGTSLTSIVVPDAVTKIGTLAFSSCSSLTDVTLGKSLATIESSAFNQSDNIATVTSLNPVPPYNEYVFDAAVTSTATLKVPAGSITAYQSADAWSDFAHIEEIASTGIDGIAATQNGNVEVYNMQGVLMYSGQASSMSVDQPGIYVVRTAGKSLKVKL